MHLAGGVNHGLGYNIHVKLSRRRRKRRKESMFDKSMFTLNIEFDTRRLKPRGKNNS